MILPCKCSHDHFAIEAVTGSAPDGIFDNAIYYLQIACHYNNQSSSALNNVELYLQSVGDPVSCRLRLLIPLPPSRRERLCW